ncbi:MAG: type II secretion system protein [Phycisphaeraceae bacterium]
MHRYCRERAFTLLELLVVISIVAVLIGILLPALGSARESAERVSATSDLRQVGVAYATHHTDHGGEVLWGKPPWSVNGRSITVKAPDGTTLTGEIAARYPWRLVPYLEQDWNVLFSHAQPPTPPSANAYTLSLQPSFGINSAYVGGHDGAYEGFVVDTAAGVKRPNVGKHVVFHRDEVRRTSGLIVFAEAQAMLADQPAFGEPGMGFHHVTPPRGGGEKWTVTGGEISVTNSSALLGIPEGRYGDTTLAAFFDGHVAGLSPLELIDMRLWANEADAAGYDFEN